jgi:hypothetical protein
VSNALWSLLLFVQAPATLTSAISLPAVHVAAQACTNNAPTTPCKRKVEPQVAASPHVAPAPGRPTTFAAMMQLLDAKAKAQAHSPAPSAESTGAEFTGADIIGADAIVPSNNVRAPAVAAPAGVAPPQVGLPFNFYFVSWCVSCPCSLY